MSTRANKPVRDAPIPRCIAVVITSPGIHHICRYRATVTGTQHGVPGLLWCSRHAPKDRKAVKHAERT